MKIVGVKFNGDGRVYYFNPNGLNLKIILQLLLILIEDLDLVKLLT